MKIVVIKQIHSSFASVSTGDREVQKVLNLTFAPFVGLELGSKDWEGGTIKELYYDVCKNEFHCWVDADETYCDINNLTYHATKEEMDKLEQKYIDEGWIKNDN